MIPLDISHAFMIYLGLLLITLMCLWIAYLVKQARTRPPPLMLQLYRCEYCSFSYLGDSDNDVTCCPQCKLFNKK